MLVGHDPQLVRSQLERLNAGAFTVGRRPPLWDGHAAERIVEVWQKR